MHSEAVAVELRRAMLLLADDYASLFKRICEGDDAAPGDLYERMHRGILYLLNRKLGRECAEGKLRDVSLSR